MTDKQKADNRELIMATQPQSEECPDYVGRAMERIERDGTLAITVRGMSSAQIRALCDVPVDDSPNPPGFSPRKVQNVLLHLIPETRRRKRQERLRDVIETAIRTVPGEQNTTVILDDRGRVILSDQEVF